jgi:hypothetical protein
MKSKFAAALIAALLLAMLPVVFTAAPVSAQNGVLRVTPNTPNINQVIAQSNARKIIFARGDYTKVQVVPKARTTYIGWGANLNGMGNTEFAFRSSANQVTIKGFNIFGYGRDLQVGVISSIQRGNWVEPVQGSGTQGMRWRVIGVEVHHNIGAGVLVATGGLIRGSKIYSNSQIGITTHGGHNIRVVGNELYDNKTDPNIDPFWEGGETKFKFTTNTKFENNFVHDSRGAGIWFDIDNLGSVVRNNRVENVANSCIYAEANQLPVNQSTLPAELAQGAPYAYTMLAEGNTVTNCGTNDRGFPWGAGMQIAASTDVIFQNNTVNNSTEGIFVVSQARLDTPSLLPIDYQVERITINNNRVNNSNMVGAFQDNGDTQMFNEISMAGNTYTGPMEFRWTTNQGLSSLQGWSQG